MHNLDLVFQDIQIDSLLFVLRRPMVQVVLKKVPLLTAGHTGGLSSAKKASPSAWTGGASLLEKSA